VHHRRVTPLSENLVVGELLGDGLDGLAPLAVLVLVDEAGGVFGRNARDDGAAQGVDQAWLVRGAGMDANPRPEVARRQRRVGRRSAKRDPLVVQAVDGDVA
jgi:hypothetical protein